MELYANRWADGTLGPHGDRLIERFRLDGTTPVWTFACADAQIEKRIWMEPGANTTYVRYALLRGSAPAALVLKVVVNYRDFHASTHAGGWRMAVDASRTGCASRPTMAPRPFAVLAEGAAAAPAHEWYLRYGLAREAERGLDAVDDNLHAGTLRIALAPRRVRHRGALVGGRAVARRRGGMAAARRPRIRRARAAGAPQSPRGRPARVDRLRSPPTSSSSGGRSPPIPTRCR